MIRFMHILVCERSDGTFQCEGSYQHKRHAVMDGDYYVDSNKYVAYKIDTVKA